MILLALDTCDARGSVAVLQDETILGVAVHETAEDYSSWLLPAVEGVLKAAGVNSRDVEVYVVASGPGSFTGLRVGLTTVKAWSEVYGRPVVAVSRLEALAKQVPLDASYVAAIADAQREQIFGALYRRDGGRLERIEEESVMAPGKFVEWVSERVGSAKVVWVKPGDERITQVESWATRENAGDEVERVGAVLAPAIGRIGNGLALEGRMSDALTLAANYVRRSDAEIFWKAGASRGGS